MLRSFGLLNGYPPRRALTRLAGTSALVLLFRNQCDLVDDRLFYEILVSLSHEGLRNFAIEVRFAAGWDLKKNDKV
jgi:hypothetical protein